jgi:signal transduction histidine kinase
VHLNLRAKSCHVTADAAKFQQIIWNLLKNPIKFTPEAGDITVSSDNPSETVSNVSVSDTGIGMEPEVMQRIFDPSSRATARLSTFLAGSPSTSSNVSKPPSSGRLVRRNTCAVKINSRIFAMFD